MYNIQRLRDNKMCTCLYVLVWDNFTCRMQLQASITFHKINLSSYFLTTVSWHLHTYSTACHQLVYESFVYFRCIHIYFFAIKNDLYKLSLTNWLMCTVFPKGCLWLPNLLKCTAFCHITTQSEQKQQNHRMPLVRVVLLGSELLSELITSLWLNLKGFLWILMTVRLFLCII